MTEMGRTALTLLTRTLDMVYNYTDNLTQKQSVTVQKKTTNTISHSNAKLYSSTTELPNHYG